MSTQFTNRQWRLPNNENKAKQSNYSINFDSANNDHIETSSNVGISGSQSRTMSVWLKGGTSNNNKSWPMAVAFGQASTNKAMWIGGGGGPNSSAYWYFGWWGTDLDSNVRMDADNDWHLLTSVYDGNTQIAKGYIDGVEVISGSRPSINTTDSTLKIGEHLSSAVYWNGEIDGVAIFDYALSSSQVTTLYGSSSTGIGNPMTLNPVAYYPLGDQDAFNGSNYLVPNSSLKDYVFDFDASSSNYINIGTVSNFQGSTTQASVSVWFNYDTTGGYVYNIDNGLGCALIVSNTQIDVYIGNIAFRNTSVSLSSGNWNNFILTIDFSQSNNIDRFNGYLNGTLLTNQNSSNINSIPTGDFIIGARRASSNYFNGKISNAQIFNTALSSTDAETLYNYGSPIKTLANIPQNSNLQGWWKLDASATYDSSTTTWSIPDDSTNSNTGTSSGMTQANLVQSDLSFTSGYSPYALDFDSASSDYIDAGDTTYLNNLSQMTLSIWFNLDVAAQDKGLIGDYYGSNTGHFGLSTKQISGNNYSLRTLINGGGNRFDITGSPFTLGQWHNLVMVFNAGTLNFYIDGQTAAFSIYSGSIPSSLSSDNKDLTIGRRHTLYWNGKLSNVSIWNTALTSAQVTEIYNEGVPSNLNNHSAYSNLVSWWQLGSNSSFNSSLNQWTCIDEKGTNTGESSQTFNEDAIVDGVGSYANGLSSGMGGDEVIGDAPYSTANSLSVNMDVEDRVTDTPS